MLYLIRRGAFPLGLLCLLLLCIFKIAIPTKIETEIDHALKPAQSATTSSLGSKTDRPVTTNAKANRAHDAQDAEFRLLQDLMSEIKVSDAELAKVLTANPSPRTLTTLLLLGKITRDDYWQRVSLDSLDKESCAVLATLFPNGSEAQTGILKAWKNKDPSNVAINRLLDFSQFLNTGDISHLADAANWEGNGVALETAKPTLLKELLVNQLGRDEARVEALGFFISNSVSENFITELSQKLKGSTPDKTLLETLSSSPQAVDHMMTILGDFSDLGTGRADYFDKLHEVQEFLLKKFSHVEEPDLNWASASAHMSALRVLPELYLNLSQAERAELGSEQTKGSWAATKWILNKKADMLPGLATWNPPK